MTTDEVDQPDPTDHVARIIAQWGEQRPDLDVSPMGLIGRLHRLGARLHEELRPVFAEAGLGDGDFDVLAAMRRTGPEQALTPSELAATTMVTSGAITKRLDRLERAGLVSRTVSDTDGRSRRVALTSKGLRLVDRLVEKHVANEHRLVAGLSERDRVDLARLLQAWARSLDA